MMKKILFYTGFILGLLLSSPTVMAQEVMSYPIETIDGKSYYCYTVERSVGLYRISIKFGVKQEEILAANPSLQRRGLRMGEKILIPINTPLPVENEEKEEQKIIEVVPKSVPDVVIDTVVKTILTDVDSLSDLQDSVAIDSLILSDTLRMDTLVVDSTLTRLAILLPFQTDAIKRDKSIDRFYDFYAGSLIAIYEEQAKGQALEIWTYDIGRTPKELLQVLDSVNLHEMDAIIGPAFSQQVSIVADTIRQDSVWMLIPFISKVKEMDSHPYLLKFNPSAYVEADTIARYLAQRKDSINCVILEAKEGEVVPAGIAALHQALKEYNVPQTQVSIRAILSDSMDYALMPDVENLIIFNTEKYSNLQAVMPHLLNASSRFKMTLFSHYSWQNERIELPQLYTSVFSPEYVVPASYDELYRYYFNHELSSLHPRYDLLGYDLTKQLLQIMDAAEKDSVSIRDTMMNQYWEGIQVDIHYQPMAEEGGLENNVVHIIHQ